MAHLELTLTDDAPPAAAGAAVQAVAADLGLSAERATRLRALVEQLVLESREREAVDGARDVVVRTNLGADRLRVHVVDRRLPLRASDSRHATSRRLVALGFADHLHVRCSGVDGNVARCEVALEAPVGTEHDAAPTPAEDVPRASDAEAAALVVRPMEPEDAPALARCLYRCYGYTYLDPGLYDPRQVRRVLRSGAMRSVVAVAPDGDVVGHSALTFEHEGDPVPEAGKLVVDPRFRGHHLAERLAARRREWADASGLPGYWAECVTNHPFSQREVIGCGGAETGLLIGATPASLTMEALANHAGRHSLVPMFVPLAATGRRTVHVAERHVGLLGQMVGAVGLDREVRAADAAPAGGPTELTVDVSVPAGTAHVRVSRIGPDLMDRVADELEGLQAFELGAVHLDLRLEEPSAGWAVTGLERLGFCWGAWVPCFAADGGDVLRLQRTGDHPVDVTEIACARPEGEAVRDAVIAEWHRVHHAR